jgi:hypothetical protein
MDDILPAVSQRSLLEALQRPLLAVWLLLLLLTDTVARTSAQLLGGHPTVQCNRRLDCLLQN